MNFLIKSIIVNLALSAILAAAFSPHMRPGRGSSLLRMTESFQNEIGVQPPLGLWDPLGLLRDADQARFDRLRAVETKHGRICMLAILGHIVTTAGIRLPGESPFGVPFSSVKAGLAAFDSIPAFGTLELVLFIGLLELGFAIRKDDIEVAQLSAAANKLGWDNDTINKKLAIELNNGRAAQMGILALMVHEKLDNNPYIINSLLNHPVPFN